MDRVLLSVVVVCLVASDGHYWAICLGNIYSSLSHIYGYTAQYFSTHCTHNSLLLIIYCYDIIANNCTAYLSVYMYYTLNKYDREVGPRPTPTFCNNTLSTANAAGILNMLMGTGSYCYIVLMGYSLVYSKDMRYLCCALSVRL